MNRILKSLQKPLVTLFLLCLFPMGALAQNVVKGTVNDEAGEPIIGATVKVQGSQQGSITDFDGKFSIQAASTENLPSKSVMDPALLPFTFTVAPMIGSPASSFTVPFTTF